MTIGQRIAQRRKEQSLSQEALGERLGVSRQAIYKWESDTALPEIEKLLALSRLFGVTVGWLLGAEEETAEASTDSGELTETQLAMVQEIVDRYLAAQPQPKKRRKWPFVLAGIVLFFAVLNLFEEFDVLRMQNESLQNNISRVERSVDSQINSITSRVEEVLKAQNNLTADYGTEILHSNLKENLIVFSVYAVPKTYSQGMTVQFQASDGSGGNSQVTGEPDSTGQKFSANLACALTDSIDLSVIFISADGTRQTQLLETYSYLYSESLPSLRVEDYGVLMGKTPSEGSSALGSLDLTEVYVTTTPDQLASVSAVNAKLGQAQAASIRVGLFRNKALVAWAEPCDQPASFHGFEGHSFFRLPDQAVSVGPNSVLCFAAVVTDEFGRTVMAPGMEYVLGGDNALTWAEEQKTDANPANWTF